MRATLITVKEYFIITIGTFIIALAWTAFLIPSQIAGGGINGVASLIYYATNTIPVGSSVFAINSLLILIAIKFLGKGFGVKTIYAILTMSLFFTILQQLITKAVVNDMFMCAIIGGVLGGIGVGITFTQGGTTGGTDIIAMMITKYKDISPAKIILYIDIIIISSSYFIFGSIEKIVYGCVAMASAAYAIDMIIVGATRSVQVFIFSNKHEAIANAISMVSGRGITLLNGQGWYTKENKKIIIIVARKKEVTQIFKEIKQIDQHAFISVTGVQGVYGKGFDQIK